LIQLSSGKGKPKAAELHALRKALERAKRERDIIKKALGYFAKVPE
jgi:transposase-like protein